MHGEILTETKSRETSRENKASHCFPKDSYLFVIGFYSNRFINLVKM